MGNNKITAGEVLRYQIDHQRKRVLEGLEAHIAELVLLQKQIAGSAATTVPPSGPNADRHQTLVSDLERLRTLSETLTIVEDEV